MCWETSFWIFNLLSTIFGTTRARGFQIWYLALKHSTNQFALNIRKLWARVTRFNPYGFLVLTTTFVKTSKFVISRRCFVECGKEMYENACQTCISIWMTLRTIFTVKFVVCKWGKNWGTGLAQWWEHSPPTNVARVQFPDPASYVGWVCWFSTLHREVFTGYSGFPSPEKPTFDLLCVNC